MKTDAELYDEFFAWLDDKIVPVEVPQIFPELRGLTISGSDLLAQIQICEKGDYYCDVLYELWYKHTYGSLK